jgi:hypothetical protein
MGRRFVYGVFTPYGVPWGSFVDSQILSNNLAHHQRFYGGAGQFAGGRHQLVFPRLWEESLKDHNQFECNYSAEHKISTALVP